MANVAYGPATPASSNPVTVELAAWLALVNRSEAGVAPGLEHR